MPLQAEVGLLPKVKRLNRCWAGATDDTLTREYHYYH